MKKSAKIILIGTGIVITGLIAYAVLKKPYIEVPEAQQAARKHSSVLNTDGNDIKMKKTDTKTTAVESELAVGGQTVNDPHIADNSIRLE